MATWHVEVRQEGLNKFRAVRGKNKYEAEQKARAQLPSWEAQYPRRLRTKAEQAARAHERASKENKRQEAEARTAEARAAITDALSILKHTLRVDDRIAWESLKSTMAFPEASPQRPIEHGVPARTFLDFIIPGRWKKTFDELYQPDEVLTDKSGCCAVLPALCAAAFPSVSTS
jgi:hypothetical protein